MIAELILILLIVILIVFKINKIMTGEVIDGKLQHRETCQKVRYKCNKCNKIYKTIVKPGIVFDKYKHHTITIYPDCGKHKDEKQ